MKRNFCITLFIIFSVFAEAQEVEPDTLKRGAMRRERVAAFNEQLDSLKIGLQRGIRDFGPNYNADSVRRELESGHYFSLFKDNYFIGGIPLGQKITANNANVKFQFSIRHRLTKSRLPFDTFLFLQFSQKTIWNVLEKSLPMYDLNFNPGIGIGHIIVNKNRYIGQGYLMIEHESNGKDGLTSRSWNKVSLGVNLMFSNNFDGQMKLWVPIIDSENNRDICEYNGIGHFGLNYHNDSNRFIFGFLTTWRTRSFSFNTQWELSFKLDKKENQYIFVQYYNGYGEYLLDYNHFHSTLRMGFVIKPQAFSFY